MGRELSHIRLEEVYDFIIEISKGNFTLQLDAEGAGELEPLILLLNIMNEELNMLFHNIHDSESKPFILVLSFIVKENLDIFFISKAAKKILLKDESQAYDNLMDLLTTKSFKKTTKYIENFISKNNSRNRIKLNFKNNKGLLFKTEAEIVQLTKKDDHHWFLISAFKEVQKNKKLEHYRNQLSPDQLKKNRYPTRNRSILLQENREMIERLRNHLIKNLDQPFPGIKELATFSNASESKIKKGFKYYYGTSIYKYFNEKRFEKAHLLLTQTEKQVSTIARECGFVNAAHFSRSFKEKFGYRPSDVQRKPE